MWMYETTYKRDFRWTDTRRPVYRVTLEQCGSTNHSNRATPTPVNMGPTFNLADNDNAVDIDDPTNGIDDNIDMQLVDEELARELEEQRQVDENGNARSFVSKNEMKENGDFILSPPDMFSDREKRSKEGASSKSISWEIVPETDTTPSCPPPHLRGKTTHKCGKCFQESTTSTTEKDDDTSDKPVLQKEKSEQKQVKKRLSKNGVCSKGTGSLERLKSGRNVNGKYLHHINPVEHNNRYGTYSKEIGEVVPGSNGYIEPVLPKPAPFKPIQCEHLQQVPSKARPACTIPTRYRSINAPTSRTADPPFLNRTNTPGAWSPRGELASNLHRSTMACGEAGKNVHCHAASPMDLESNMVGPISTQDGSREILANHTPCGEQPASYLTRKQVDRPHFQLDNSRNNTPELMQDLLNSNAFDDDLDLIDGQPSAHFLYKDQTKDGYMTSRDNSLHIMDEPSHLNNCSNRSSNERLNNINFNNHMKIKSELSQSKNAADFKHSGAMAIHGRPNSRLSTFYAGQSDACQQQLAGHLPCGQNTRYRPLQPGRSINWPVIPGHNSGLGHVLLSSDGSRLAGGQLPHQGNQAAMQQCRKNAMEQCRRAEQITNYSEKIRNELQQLIAEAEGNSAEADHQVDIQKRKFDEIANEHRAKLQVELSTHIRSDEELEKIRRDGTLLLHLLERHLQANKRNRKDREMRWWPDAIEDEVEVQLRREAETLVAAKNVFRTFLNKVKAQIQHCVFVRGNLSRDILWNEDDIYKSRQNGLRRFPRTWHSLSSQNLVQSEVIRESCERLRDEGRSLLRYWKDMVGKERMTTNRYLEERVARLMRELETTRTRSVQVVQEIRELESVIQQLDVALEKMFSPLQISTRMGQKTYYQASLQEMKSLCESREALNGKIREARTALQDLMVVRFQLEREERTKLHSINIDNNRVLEMRQSLAW